MDKDKEKSSGVSVAYQNKDISAKAFAEDFKDTFFKVFGLDLPSIVRVEPTELPAIEVNDMTMDRLYYLADGTHAIIDFESKYSEENKVKYLGYIARLLKRVYNQTRRIPKLRVIIIYTADVEEGTTTPWLDMGDERLFITEAFLSNLNADRIIEDCKQKIYYGISLSDEEKLSIMLCPMAIKGKTGKIDAIHRVIAVVNDIDDEKTKIQILSGMMAFCDKVISEEDVEEIRRIIMMSKWDRLIYNEKMEAVNEKTCEIAKNLLNDGLSAEAVSRNTGLDISVVEDIANKISAEKSNKDAVPV